MGGRGGVAARLPGAATHAPAIGVLVILFVVGVVAADGYGQYVDTKEQTRYGKLALQYVRGENTDLLNQPILRCYGVAFEIALLGAQRVLGFDGRTDVQHVFLARHLLSHGFFLVGTFACYLLAWRLFKNRAVALFGMCLLLAHPRLYGHSFFNFKDMPFLSMFMIGLLLAHWALRRGSVAAYATLGAWLGLASTARPMAFLLLSLVALARGMDFFSGTRRERTHILASVGALVVAAGAAFFAGLPYLWGDPLARFASCLSLLSDHPTVVTSFFLGELIRSDDRPLSYIPVWVAVTTPPFVIVLALIGGLALSRRLAVRPRTLFTDTRQRFMVLLAACVAIPVIVTFWVGSIYDGWRHLYFVYGPLCIGAAGGLAWLAANARRRMAVLGPTAAVFGLVAIVWEGVHLHPHQHVYFNFLVDRKTPERLRTQFDLDYTFVPFKEALEFLLAAHAGRVPIMHPLSVSLDALPAAQRRRLVLSTDFSAYFVTDYRYPYSRGRDLGRTYANPVYERKVFANTLYALAQSEVDAEEGSRYRADYLLALSSPPVAVGLFDLHWEGEAITYLRKDCEPGDVYELDERRPWLRPTRQFFLQVSGDKLGDKKDAWRYVHDEGFQFRQRGVVFQDGTSRVCMAHVPLHGFQVDAIRTGQMGATGRLWAHEVGAVDAASLRQLLERARRTAPARRSHWDVYTDDGAIVYVRENCRAGEDLVPFFLHAEPFDFDGWPRSVKRLGFSNRDFSFSTHGTVLDGTCVARARLPPFQIRRVRTGQWVAAEGELWAIDLDLPPGDR